MSIALPKAFQVRPNPAEEELKKIQKKLDVPREYYNEQLRDWIRAEIDRDRSITQGTKDHIWAKYFQEKEAMVTETINDSYIEEFNCWILGKSKFNNPRYTPWGRKKLVGKTIDEYLTQFVEKKSDFYLYMAKLRQRIPNNIVDAWLYFRLIILPSGKEGIIRNEFTKFLENNYSKDWAAWFNTEIQRHTVAYEEGGVKTTVEDLRNPVIDPSNEHGYAGKICVADKKIHEISGAIPPPAPVATTSSPSTSSTTSGTATGVSSTTTSSAATVASPAISSSSSTPPPVVVSAPDAAMVVEEPEPPEARVLSDAVILAEDPRAESKVVTIPLPEGPEAIRTWFEKEAPKELRQIVEEFYGKDRELRHMEYLRILTEKTAEINQAARMYEELQNQLAAHRAKTTTLIGEKESQIEKISKLLQTTEEQKLEEKNKALVMENKKNELEEKLIQQTEEGKEKVLAMEKEKDLLRETLSKQLAETKANFEKSQGEKVKLENDKLELQNALQKNTTETTALQKKINTLEEHKTDLEELKKTSEQAVANMERHETKTAKAKKKLAQERENVRKANETLEGFKTQHDEAVKKLQTLEQQKTQLDSKLTELQRTVEQKTNENRELEKQKNQAEVQIEELKANEKKLQKTIEEEEKMSLDVSEQIAEKDETIKDLSNQLEQEKNQLTSKQQEIQNLETRLQAQQTISEQDKQDRMKLRSDLVDAFSEKDRLQKNVKKLENDLTLQKSRAERENTEKKKALEELQQMKLTRQTLETTITGHLAKITELQTELDKTKETDKIRIQELQNEIDRHQNEIQQMKETNQRFQDFLQNQQIENEKLKDDTKQLATKIDELTNQLSTSTQDAEHARKNAEQLKSLMDLYSGKAKELEQKLDESEGSRQTLQAQLQQLYKMTQISGTKTQEQAQEIFRLNQQLAYYDDQNRQLNLAVRETEKKATEWEQAFTRAQAQKSSLANVIDYMNRIQGNEDELYRLYSAIVPTVIRTENNTKLFQTAYDQQLEQTKQAVASSTNDQIRELERVGYEKTQRIREWETTIRKESAIAIPSENLLRAAAVIEQRNLALQLPKPSSTPRGFTNVLAIENGLDRNFTEIFAASPIAEIKSKGINGENQSIEITNYLIHLNNNIAPIGLTFYGDEQKNRAMTVIDSIRLYIEEFHAALRLAGAPREPKPNADYATNMIELGHDLKAYNPSAVSVSLLSAISSLKLMSELYLIRELMYESVNKKTGNFEFPYDLINIAYNRDGSPVPITYYKSGEIKNWEDVFGVGDRDDLDSGREIEEISDMDGYVEMAKFYSDDLQKHLAAQNSGLITEFAPMIDQTHNIIVNQSISFPRVLAVANPAILEAICFARDYHRKYLIDFYRQNDKNYRPSKDFNLQNYMRITNGLATIVTNAGIAGRYYLAARFKFGENVFVKDFVTGFEGLRESKGEFRAFPLHTSTDAMRLNAILTVGEIDERNQALFDALKDVNNFPEEYRPALNLYNNFVNIIRALNEIRIAGKVQYSTDIFAMSPEITLVDQNEDKSGPLNQRFDKYIKEKEEQLANPLLDKKLKEELERAIAILKRQKSKLFKEQQ